MRPAWRSNVIGFLVVVALLVAAVVFVVGLYNGLVRLRNASKNAFSQIDVQLKRRHDLIPNLVETAKGYLKHERETLEAVVRARNLAVTATATAAASPGDPAAMKGLAGAEGALGASLSRLLAVAESYPALKADVTMTRLMEELSSTENRIAFSRQAFNDAVMAYNTARETFPGLLLAGAFAAASPFEITVAAEREAVKVAF
jgi:LemA protein